MLRNEKGKRKMDLAEMLASAKEEGIKEGRQDAIDECVEIIAKIMPTEPFLKNSKHYENWKMKTTELRMLRDMLEQLKEKENDNR